MSGTVTVAALDIARIAGVGRAAVSNWRRRYDDFPQPVGGSATSPLFSLDEVKEWLAGHGRSYDVSPADLFWQRVRSAVEDIRLGELLADVGAVLVLVGRAPKAWPRLAKYSDERLVSELAARSAPEIPGAGQEAFPVAWADLFRAAVDLAEADGAAEMYELLCERYLEVRARRVPVMPADLGEQMVGLATAVSPDNPVVLDPACGTGGLLTAARSMGAGLVLGQDADETSARIAAARLLLGSAAETRIDTGDALRADAFDGDKTDIVVCDPPIGVRAWGYDELVADPRWEYGLPPRGEPELAWLQHCLTHLRSGGVATIALPSATASRRAGRRIRSNLLRAGAIRALVGLPQLASGAAVSRDLWVLVRPSSGYVPSHVLMTDPALPPADVAAAWQAFVRDPAAELPAGARAVRVIDLLDDEVDLTPDHHVAAGKGADHAAAVADASRDWRAIVDELPHALPALMTGGSTPDNEPPARTTVGELSKAGLVTIQQAPLRMDTDHGDVPVLTARDVRHGRPPSGRGTPGLGVVELAAGDIVVPVLREGPVRVVDESGALLGPNLLMLRPDLDRLDPHFLAGCLRAAQQDRPSRSPTSSGRFDPRRVAVPRLAFEEQRARGTAFRRLAELQDLAGRLKSTGDALVRSAQPGLVDGTVRPADRA